MNITLELQVRYLAKVQVLGDDDCWPWIGAKLPDGYGIIIYKGKQQMAHRLAWRIFANKKLTPYRKDCILHTCGNKSCCNPRHLYMGTLGDAHKAIGIPGRKRTDLRFGRHELTQRQKDRIKERALRGDSAAAIQRDYPKSHYRTILRYVHAALTDKNND